MIMVDPDHLAFVTSASFEALRTWRKNNPKTPLKLSGADFSLAKFDGAPLEYSDFSLADLSHASFSGALLDRSAFTRANATDANFVGAQLVGADFVRADLSGADLRKADLTGAWLELANLRNADLRGATLKKAILGGANFSEAKLDDTNFSDAICSSTIFANVDLSRALGLDQVEHRAVSTLGLDTLQRSRGNISSIFLDACGIPQSVINALRGRYRIGDEVDSWRLRERLGAGGNGEVWKAERNGRVVALKISKTLDPNDGRYRRFADEVLILRQLKDRKGVVPLIDASVPKMPSHEQPAWLAMPIAIPMTRRLSTRLLATTVEAIASIAETMSELHAQGISHRDIKPDNLFWYGDGWAVGDFGLVEFPDKQSLTKSGRKLGPIYYVAPEMLNDPVRSKGEPADVYSLAKTLWVLATGQHFPLPGEQKIDSELMQISMYVTHDRTEILDAIGQEATRHDPDKRPSMSTIAAELRAWCKSSP
jgi:uncharacterized protein YjbI with pentapeptide repeats